MGLPHNPTNVPGWVRRPSFAVKAAVTPRGTQSTGVGKINQVGLIGGTFDRFHAGHQNLLMSALSHCHRVEVWVTVDSIARAKDSRINTWEQRVEEIRQALAPDSERLEFHELEDLHGPAPTHNQATAIICTSETMPECEAINRIRQETGMPKLQIICVDHTVSWDGNPISSSRIRSGEIDRQGQRWIPESFESNEMALTPEVEAELKDPFGQLIPGPEDDPSHAMSEVLILTQEARGPLIAVGDVTVRTLQDIGRPADIGIIDGRTKRQVWEGSEGIDSSLYDAVLECSSPAGMLTPSFLSSCKKAISSWREGHKSSLIIVDGEEDLAPLFLHPLSPIDSVILYGQPGKGVVIRWCGEDAKQRCRRLLSGFETV
ncbi:MAG: hypothetical protein CMA93_00215 [Euryarchaeota archaeon]|nr:hypothetical protein [Euryarchaeota archaeon]